MRQSRCPQIKSLLPKIPSPAKKVTTPSDTSSILTLKLRNFNTGASINNPSETKIKTNLSERVNDQVPTVAHMEPKEDTKIKIDVKDTIEKTRLFSKKSKHSISGSKPDWDNLPISEREFYFNEYDVRFNILVRKNKKFDIKKPERGESLSAYIHAYDENVKFIRTSMLTTNGKLLLSLSYHLVEAVMVSYFKLSIFKGFGKFQSSKMFIYEQSMLELGEIYSDGQDENCSPWVSIAKTAAIQTIIFLIGGAVAKMMGSKKSTMIDTISSMYPCAPETDSNGEECPPSSDNESSAVDKLMGLCGGAGMSALFGKKEKSEPVKNDIPSFTKGDHPVPDVPTKTRTSAYRKPKIDDASSISSSSIYRRR